MGIEPSRVDILMGLKNLSFDECWERRDTALISGIETYFISIDDLIINKQTAGRPQDLIDVENLELKRKQKPLLKSLYLNAKNKIKPFTAKLS